MTNMLNVLCMYLLIAMAMCGLGSLISLLLSSVVQPATCPVRERARMWFLLSLPIALPVMLIVTILMLSLAKYTGLIVDHCLEHGSHHPHFCFIHVSGLLLNGHQFLLAMLALGGVLFVLISRFLAHGRQQVKERALLRLASGRGLIKTIEMEQPMAFTLGVRKPAIYLSSGLRRSLSKQQQRIVVAHELAHVRRRDVLKNRLFETLLCFHVNKRTLRNRWLFAMEASADDVVAERYNKLDVAETLIRVQRAHQSSLGQIAFSGADIRARIHRLIDPPESSRSLPFEWMFIFFIGITPFLLFEHHHALETVFGWWMMS